MIDPADSSPAPMSGLAAAMNWVAVRCTDVDDQAAALPGWRQRYQQLSPGTYDGELRHWRLPNGFACFVESSNRQLAQTVAPPAGSIAFALRADTGHEARIDQAHFGAHDIGRLSGDCDSVVTTPADARLAAIVVPQQVLIDYSDALSGRDPRWLEQGSSVSRSPMTAVLRAFVEQVLQVASDQPASLSAPQAQRALCGAAIGNLLLAIGDGLEPPCPQRATAQRRWQIVRRAREHIDAHLGDVFSVADLCKAIGVSRRTLQYCFEEALQINPVAYVRAVRLNAVRRDLKQADSRHDTVADLAARRGFWHLGHFATDYRCMFGETPSTTLHGAWLRRDSRQGANMAG